MADPRFVCLPLFSTNTGQVLGKVYIAPDQVVAIEAPEKDTSWCRVQCTTGSYRIPLSAEEVIEALGALVPSKNQSTPGGKGSAEVYGVSIGFGAPGKK